MVGKVKRFNKTKGYGFITDDQNRDLFFHYSELQMDGFKTIEVDTEVEFELYEGEKGFQARNIKVL